jgi:hypothetical protein
MAELVLLSLKRTHIATWADAKDLTDAQVEAALSAVWAGYETTPLACFLCDGEINQFPPYTHFLPEPLSQLQAIAAPICETCWSLPQMVRLNRCLKLLREMHKARKTGRQFHYDMVRKRW